MLTFALEHHEAPAEHDEQTIRLRTLVDQDLTGIQTDLPDRSGEVLEVFIIERTEEIRGAETLQGV
jgi:hypothetical protein